MFAFEVEEIPSKSSSPKSMGSNFLGTVMEIYLSTNCQQVESIISCGLLIIIKWKFKEVV